MSTDLEALKAQYDADNIEDEVVDDQQEDGNEVIDDELEDDQEEQHDEAPPGLKTYDQWIAEGRDPEKFKGRKAYEAEYKRIQEVKELKSSVKGMAETLKATVEAIADRETKAEARHRKELEAALNDAKETGDIDAALDATEQLHQLNNAPKQQARREHPVIADFIEDNVILESPEIRAEFQEIYNGILRGRGVGANTVLSEGRIKLYLKSAMDEVKSIFPEKFSSQKVNRQVQVKGNRVPASKVNDVTQQLKSYKVSGVSKQNEGAALDIYNSLMKTSPGAAKLFAQNLLNGD